MTKKPEHPPVPPSRKPWRQPPLSEREDREIRETLERLRKELDTGAGA